MSFVYSRLPRKTDMERYVSLNLAWKLPVPLFISLKLNLILTNLSFDHVFCRKIEIVQFASRTRQLFVRLLALVKWASNAGKVEKCAVSWVEISFHEIRPCGWASIVRQPSDTSIPINMFFPLSFISITTDDLQLLGSADHPVCGHSRQTSISGQRCPRTCPSAQFCHPLRHRCSHHRVLPSPAHMYTSKAA